MARKPRTCKSCRREFTPSLLTPSKRCSTCRSGFLITPPTRKQGAVTTFRVAPWTDRRQMVSLAVLGERRLPPAAIAARATELAVILNPTPGEVELRRDEDESRRKACVTAMRRTVYQTVFAETVFAARLTAGEREEVDPFAPATGGSWADVDPVEVMDP